MGVSDNSSIDTSLRVAQFISPDEEWDMAKLLAPVTPQCLQAILATPIPANQIPDSICWVLSGSGEFSTKTATWAAHGLDLQQSNPRNLTGSESWILCSN